MKPRWRPRTISEISTPTPSPVTTVSRRCPFPLALAIILGLATIALPTQAQTFTSLYSFAAGTDGDQPMGLVRDKAGNLYGTTLYGGGGRCSFPAGCGIVFKLDASGHETVLHAFTGGRDGELPWATLILDSSGNLYGATVQGGNLNCGTVGGCGTLFKLNASGSKSLLYFFPSSSVASLPYGFIRDAKGNLYGTTAYGGTCGCGTVFKLDAAGTESILYTFAGGADGSRPYAGVIQDKAGNLFGTTYYGGTSNSGTIFEVDSAGNETVLYSFGSETGDGTNPIPGLLEYAGNLYGTASSSGPLSNGTVFKLDKSGVETVLYNFSGGNDGGRPMGNLITDGAGNLYGTTYYGGAFGGGTVFELSVATGQYTVLHSFSGAADGIGPSAGLVRDPEGNLYGTTILGGTFDAGTVFKIAP